MDNDKILEEIKARLIDAQKEKLTFLLMGQTGRGKSSTINSLLGFEIAPVNDFEPETMMVVPYDAEVNGIKFQAIDTPGLCDDLEEKQNDDKYITLITDKIKEFDCLWFVSRLDDTRVTNDEKRAISIITKSFGKEVWNNAVIVFTFAGNIAKDKFSFTFSKRAELIRSAIESCTNVSIAKDVPAVAVDNQQKYLPNGDEWLGELYTKTFLRITKEGKLTFFLITSDRLNLAEDNKENSNSDKDFAKSTINLNSEQTRQIKDNIIANSAALGFVIGAKFGLVLGPAGSLTFGAAGAAIGGAVGAVIKIFGGLFR